MKKNALIVALILLSGTAVISRQKTGPHQVARIVDGGAPEPGCIPGDPNCKP